MISIIITNYNGEKFLSKCLRAIFDQTYKNFEVILVDNNSSDGSISLVRKEFPDVIIIRNLVNRGYAGGCNDGARKSRGDFLLFLNTDTIAEPDFLEILNKSSELYPNYGMYASKMIYPDGRINSTGICISLSGAAWDRGMGEKNLGQYNQIEEIFGPCGGAALYRRDIFEKLGGYDEDFFLYMEDVDLACRIQLSGFRCLYLPDAKIYHYHGGTAGVESDITIYYGNRNIIWYPIKDFPFVLLLISLFWMSGRTVGTLFYYSYKGRGKIAYKSKKDALLGILMILRKRRNQKIPIIPSKRFSKFFHIWAFSR